MFDTFSLFLVLVCWETKLNAPLCFFFNHNRRVYSQTLSHRIEARIYSCVSNDGPEQTILIYMQSKHLFTIEARIHIYDRVLRMTLLSSHRFTSGPTKQFVTSENAWKFLDRVFVTWPQMAASWIVFDLDLCILQLDFCGE